MHLPHLCAVLMAASVVVGCDSASRSPAPAPTAPAKDKTPLHPTAATSASASTPAAKPTAKRKAFKEIVLGVKQVRVVWRKMTGSAMKEHKKVEVTDADKVAAIVDAFGPEQRATDAQPRCLTPFVFSFEADGGASLAEVGLCASDGVAEKLRSTGRLMKPAAEQGGWAVADMPALRKLMKPLGIEIP